MIRAMSFLAAQLLQAAFATHASNATYRCVFVHGVGTHQTKPSSVNDTRRYWGGVERIAEHTPYCSSRYFLHQDTTIRGWDDSDLVKATCDLAVGEGSSNGTIHKTVVITHSMGNLIFAEALRSQTCSLDAASSKWISIEAPWRGSKAVKWVGKICSNKTSNKLLEYFATKFGYCNPAKPGEVFPGFQTLMPEYPGLKDLAAFAKTKVHRAMCGTSPHGLRSKYSLALEALASEVKYGMLNDGMVAVDSCVLPDVEYDRHYRAPFYLAHVNHADGTCRTRTKNAAAQPPDRLPCEWLASALKEEGIAAENTKQIVMV
jgi:hypothetical protein